MKTEKAKHLADEALRTLDSDLQCRRRDSSEKRHLPDLETPGDWDFEGNPYDPRYVKALKRLKYQLGGCIAAMEKFAASRNITIVEHIYDEGLDEETDCAERCISLPVKVQSRRYLNGMVNAIADTLLALDFGSSSSVIREAESNAVMVAFASVVGYCSTRNLIDDFDDDVGAVREVVHLSHPTIHRIVSSMLEYIDDSLVKRQRQHDLRLRVTQVVYTWEASHANIDRYDLNHALWRHERGDYGRVKKFHRDWNDLWSGGNGVISGYKDRRGTRFCVYTHEGSGVTIISLVRE